MYIRISTRAGTRRRVLAICIVPALAVAGCHRATQPESASAPVRMPRLPSEQIISRPPTLPAALDSTPVASEPLISIDTGDHDMDVKQALEFIAQRGGFSLTMSPNLKTRVRLHLVDAPASEALVAVLAQANLTLTPTTAVQVSWNPSIVFYQLPVNIDSLSADAIVKRFNISREMA